MKYFRFFLIYIFFSIPLSAESFSLSELQVEAKVSAFFPSSKRVRHIYSDAIAYYELEIANRFCNNWQIWLGAGYLADNGHALGCKNKTSFRLVPITLGLKYFFSITPCIDLYTGAGACWSFVNTTDHSQYVHKHISDNALGGIFKIGAIYQVKENIFIDLFTEYLYQHFSFHHHYEDHYTIRHNLNTSGFKIGVGLGFNF